VLGADGRVLAHDEQTVEAAVEGADHRRIVGMGAGDLALLARLGLERHRTR
jgi:hypothetical protein